MNAYRRVSHLAAHPRSARTVAALLLGAVAAAWAPPVFAGIPVDIRMNLDKFSKLVAKFAPVEGAKVKGTCVCLGESARSSAGVALQFGPGASGGTVSVYCIVPDFASNGVQDGSTVCSTWMPLMK